ncbi:hypothetical protein [Jeotgalibacillus marinus]|uniref:Abortive phage infection protein n=1 Tax=Jeotgalibacillus marinus TaxID=86667 RepID=A0ABV3Q704_9BACL
MEREKINQLLEELKERTVIQISITKSDFSSFREVLVQREDFKHFRGIAQRDGHVIYEYLDEARS